MRQLIKIFFDNVFILFMSSGFFLLIIKSIFFPTLRYPKWFIIIYLFFLFVIAAIITLSRDYTISFSRSIKSEFADNKKTTQNKINIIKTDQSIKSENQIEENNKDNESIKLEKIKMDELYVKLNEIKNSDEIEQILDSIADNDYESLNNDDYLEVIDDAMEDLKITKTMTKQFYRSLLVKEYVSRRAKGSCELCNNPAPFKDNNGHPFLENHHIDWLSKGGKDTIANCVALCSNCHRKVHVLKYGNDIAYLKLQVGLTI